MHVLGSAEAVVLWCSVCCFFGNGAVAALWPFFVVRSMQSLLRSLQYLVGRHSFEELVQACVAPTDAVRQCCLLQSDWLKHHREITV